MVINRNSSVYKLFVKIFFIFCVPLFYSNSSFAECKLNSFINISVNELLQVPSFGAPTNKVFNPGGRYRIIDKKGNYIKVKKNSNGQTGWVSLDKGSKYDNSLQRWITVNEECQSKTKKNNTYFVSVINNSYNVSYLLEELDYALKNNPRYSKPKNNRSPIELLKDAKNALAKMQNYKATKILNEIIGSSYSNSNVNDAILAETYHILGRIYFIEKNYTESIKFFAIRHRDLPNVNLYKASNYYWLARSLFEIGDGKNGCLILEDIIFSNQYNDYTNYINEAKLTSKDKNCNLISNDWTSTYQVSNNLDEILGNTESFSDNQTLSQNNMITAKEIDTLRNQLYSCLTVNTGVSNLRNLKPVINIKVNRDRRVTSAKIVNYERLSDPSFRTAAEAAMRAVNNPDCSPLMLPPEKYDQWKEINFTFNFSWMFDQPDQTIKQKIKTLYVDASSLNVRSTPNGSEILGTLTRNSKVQQIEITPNWSKVKDLNTGLEGWVSNNYLSENLTSDIEDTYIASQPSKEDKSQLIENKIIELEIAEKDNDLEPPKIQCNQNIKTNKTFVDIKCQIQDESNLIALVVDRESISPNKNFEHKVQVPIGDSEIKVQALDEYGNKSDYIVSIQREFFEFIEEQDDLERLLPGGIQVSKNENRIAVIFGIKGYQSIPDTKYADKDALAFIDYASYNLGISPRNIKYFINQDASYFNILDLESWLSNRIDENTEVFVFYSGHGLNNNGEAIILPYDFRKTQIERSSIEKNSFIEEILGYQPGHVYAFFDACFSGLGRENESLIEGLRNISIVEEEKINNVTIFNSSSGAEFSSDLDEAGHGLFSYYLMKGLEGKADLNQDRKITTNELYSYVEDNVSTKALSIGFPQNPSLITSEDKVILQW